MSILTSIKRQAAIWTQPAQTKAVADYRPDLRYREHLSSSAAGEAAELADSFMEYASVYRYYGWVRRAVTLTANSISGLPVGGVDANSKAIDNHPITLLLAAGNDAMPASQVWDHYVVSMLLAGESFLEIIADKRGQPLWLWPRRSDRVLVQPDIAAERLYYPAVAGYLAQPDTNEGGAGIAIAPEQMIHDKFSNPINPWPGLSLISAVRQSIIIDMYAQAWSKLFLKRGARPDYAVIAPQGITNTEKTRIQEELLFQFGGSDNWHKPIVLEQGITDIKPFSFPPKDMEWLAEREMSRDEVAGLFGVPDEIMGYGKNTYENFQAALGVFWTLALQPLVQHRDVTLTHFFGPRAKLLAPGQRIETDLSTVGVLQEDKAPKVIMAKTLWDMGAPFNQLDEQLQLGVGKVPNGDKPFGKDPQAVPPALPPFQGQNGKPGKQPPAGDMSMDEEDMPDA